MTPPPTARIAWAPWRGISAVLDFSTPCAPTSGALAATLIHAHRMHPHLIAVSRQQFHVFTTEQARQGGYSQVEIDASVRTGVWRKLRRGVFTSAETWDAADERTKHLIRGAAVLVASSQAMAVSSWSAALAHELPLIRPIPEIPWIVTQREHSRRIEGARLQAGTLHPGHRVLLDGLGVTSVARTISDVARTSRRHDEALVMLEHALRFGWVTRDDMVNVIRACPTWRGIAFTKRVLQLAQPKNESPGETLSYLRIRELGMPLPECQVAVRVGGSSYRLDFLWPDLGVVGEFDGTLKYEAKSDLIDEKRREDALRSAGLVVARWGWGHVRRDGARLEPVLRHAFGLAGKASVDWSRLHVA